MQDSQRGRRTGIPQKGSDFWRSPTRPDRHPLGNLIYFGTGLHRIGGPEAEPALIDPRLPVDGRVKDCHGGGQGWEPHYARCSAQMRAAYLLWLNAGRSDPRAPISHVFLYFYGLERRAVSDARLEPAAREELPVIREEIARLRRVYGAHGRFKKQSTALLEYLAAEGLPPRSFSQAPVLREDGLSYVEQLILGQCAQTGMPLPAAWAFRFVQGGLRMWPAGLDARGLQQTQECFEEIYQQRFGAGMVIPMVPARLQLKYCPASPSFGEGSKTVIAETGLPNLLEEHSWYLPLLALAQEVQSRLSGAPLSGSVDQESQQGAEAPPAASGKELLQKPLAQWPYEPRRFLEAQRARVSQGGNTTVMLSSFVKVFPEMRELTSQSLLLLARVLAQVCVGMMPDPRFGVPPLRPERAVLFLDDPLTAAPEPSEAYRAALLRLELAGAVMSGDRSFLRAHAPQMSSALRQEQGLTLSEQRRLGARLTLLLLGPPSLSSLRPALVPLGGAQRQQLREYLRTVLGSSEPPERVRMALDSCLKLLGADAASAPPPAGSPKATASRSYRIPPPPPPARPPEVSLDQAKIDELQRENVRLVEILGTVFAEGDGTQSVAPSSGKSGSGGSEPDAPCLLGLDPATSAFLRLLLGRATWGREELAGFARQRGLPLDGVLERINETCFERLDMPLFEEADPLVLLPETVAAITGAG